MARTLTRKKTVEEEVPVCRVSDAQLFEPWVVLDDQKSEVVSDL